MNASYQLGQQGESLACEHYSRRGATIVERNWRFGRAEIDLIVLDKGELVFVEVKTRRNQSFGGGFEAIPPWKQRHLERAATAYQQKHSSLYGELPVRFDVVVITFDESDPKSPTLEQLSDAWEARSDVG